MSLSFAYQWKFVGWNGRIIVILYIAPGTFILCKYFPLYFRFILHFQFYCYLGLNIYHILTTDFNIIIIEWYEQYRISIIPISITIKTICYSQWGSVQLISITKLGAEQFYANWCLNN